MNVSLKGHNPQSWLETWNSLVVQWLGLWALTTEDPGSVLGQGTKISKVTQGSDPSLPPKFVKNIH